LRPGGGTMPGIAATVCNKSLLRDGSEFPILAGRRQRPVAWNPGQERSVRGIFAIGVAFSAFIAMSQAGPSPASAADGLKVVSDRTVTGFKFPESVGYDAAEKVLYVSEFVSALKPADKDGKGRISKASLDGKVIEETFLPTPGQVLNKPKGIWIKGPRLWVTDIDVVWAFDTKTKKGRSVALPGIQFANDPTVVGNVLFVSDNRADQLFRIEPADFLAMQGEPKVTRVWVGKSINPNGLYPAHDGSLLMVGFKSPQEPRGIHVMAANGNEPKALSAGLGRLDGLYQMASGTLLITDWNSGSLSSWTTRQGLKPLATGFKGPADFAVVPIDKGLMVVVPDLVKSELRMIQLGQ
jgi:hypothetical protein